MECQGNVAATDVRLVDVVKRFGEAVAVDHIHLEVQKGEFFSLLGPSGCGKTTTLRMIGGFEEPTSGLIELQGEDVTWTPPFRRNVNTVFQNYALFPHLTIYENVAFGLRRKGVKDAEVKRRVAEMLELVELPGFETRKPTQISGGQAQRVALARALVNRPAVLLLDEPLGALDLKLRKQMQVELKRIQQEVGITFIYVTHDQGEALTMSDRMAVFNKGRIEQIGTPADVYEKPSTRFVAGFVGTSNLLTGDAAEQIIGAAGTYTVRPEKIHLGEPADTPGSDESSGLGTISKVVYLGPDTRYLVTLDAGPTLVVEQQNLARTSADALAQEGKKVRLTWKRLHNLALSADAQVPVQ